MKLLSALPLSVLLVSCGGLADSSDEDCVGKCDGVGALDELSTAELDSLLYQVDEAAQLPFLHLSTVQSMNSRPRLSNGRVADINVYLLRDGEAYVEYSEWRAGGFESTLASETIVTRGEWSLDGATISVGDELSGSVYRNEEDELRIDFQFLRDLDSASLRGTELTLGSVRSTGGLFHVLDKFNDGICEPRFGEYCAYGTDCGPCECGDGVCQRADEDADECPEDCD